MEPRTCRGERLGEGPVCKVEICPCETIHVSIGILTVRLQRDAFAAFCDTLFAAAARLASRRPHPGGRAC
jgi:hypothetical protein